jgi:hypothetical protein
VRILAALCALGIVVVGCVAFVRTQSVSRLASESAVELESPIAPAVVVERESVPVVTPPASLVTRPQFLLVGVDTTPLNPARGTEEMLGNINAGRAEGEAPRTFTLFIGTGGMTFDPDRHRLPAADEPLRGVLPRNAYVFHYAESRHDVEVTVENIRRLAERGVEIGAHTVRHLHGRAFSRERWDFELTDHARILDLLGLARPVGFRAPFLETSDDLYDSLGAHGYTYDCSATQNARRWPTRHGEDGIWIFGVPTVHIPGREGPVLLYDLNLDARLHAAAVDAGVHGEPAIRAWMDDTFERVAFTELMNRYRSSRAPFLVSGHGGFQRPIARLMRRVCGMPDMRCSTFREATAFMDAHPELAGAD